MRSFWAARSSLMANATVSSSSPSASQLMVSGDSRTLTQVMVRSRPPAPASTSPLLNPPSAIASRTVSAMGVISMPYRNARVKDQRNQGLLVALHNGRSPLRLLASQPESTGVDGAYSPPESGGLEQEGRSLGPQARWYRGRIPLVLAAEHADRPSKLQGGTDGQLYDRDSRRAAPRHPGAQAPDRRGRHLYAGADRRRR